MGKKDVYTQQSLSAAYYKEEVEFKTILTISMTALAAWSNQATTSRVEKLSQYGSAKKLQILKYRVKPDLKWRRKNVYSPKKKVLLCS